jgi:exodeoxyribonuclease VII large subunit
MTDTLTVTELNILLKDSIKKFPKVKVKGELSGFRGKYNNTIYATLKDEISSINIIRFKATEDIKNGDKITAYGYIDFYAKTGDIKLMCNKIEIEGEGELLKRLDLLKKKFEEKGYFKNKKPFPSVKNIGIVTSKDGAALQDILFVLNNNKFTGNVFIKNSPVQGNECTKGVCGGIKFFNTFITKENTQMDLIMITRGGGGIDDLMGFSDPSVLEEIHNSNIFVMSAVGHEIDWMLSDYVADIRAPTPSIGAEMICKSCPNYKQKIEIFNYKDETYQKMIKSKLDMIKKNINIYRKMMYINKYQSNKKKINTMEDKITDLVKNKFNFIRNTIESLKSNINIIKSMNSNCVIKSKNKVIKNIDEIKDGVYTIEINGMKKKIEIKIL